MKQKQIYIAISILIILGGGYLLLNNGNKAEAPQTQNSDDLANVPTDVPQDDPNINTNSAVTPPSKNTLVISTQTGEGEVTVDNVYLEKPGFIVIHDIENDSPAAVIGTSGWLSAGPGQDVTFKANIKPGETYFGLLYSDNGDKKFNKATDKELPLFNKASNTYSPNTVMQFTVAK